MVDLVMKQSAPRKFDGGLNVYVADSYVADNEMLIATNARIKPDRIEEAYAFAKATNDVMDGAGKFIWGDRLGDNYYTIIAGGSNLYSLSGSTLTSIKSGLNPNAKIDMDNQQDRLFIGSTEDDPVRIDENLNVGLHGIEAPSSGVGAITEENAGLGIFPNTEVRQFYVTFYDSVHVVESNPHETADSITIAAGPSDIRLKDFPVSTNPDVDKYRIYMTENNGADWFRIDEVDYATYVTPGADYDISGTIPTLGTSLEFDNNEPEPYFLVESWRNSLFVVYKDTPDTVNFSKGFRPEQFPVPFQLGVRERITALIRYYSYLVIGTESGVWRLDRHPLDGGFPVRVTTYVGMAAHTGFAILDTVLLFMGNDSKVYSLDPTQFQQEDVRPNEVSKKIQPLTNEVNPNRLENVAMIHNHYGNPNDVYVSASAGSAVENDTIFVFDTITEGWTLDTYRAEVFGAVRDQNNNIDVFFADAAGYVFRYDTGSGYGADWSGNPTAVTASTLEDTTVINIDSIATSGGASTLTDTAQTLTVNQFLGFQIHINAGTGAGQYRTIQSNTVDTFTVSSAWTTPPDATSEYQVGGFLEKSLEGIFVTIIDGTGVDQSRRIVSHTPDTITISPDWSVLPDTLSTYAIGSIDFHVHTGWDVHTPSPEVTKRGWFMHTTFSVDDNHDIDYNYTLDFNYEDQEAYVIPIEAGGYLWGSAIWGEPSIWGIRNSDIIEHSFTDGGEYYRRIKHAYRNRFPNQATRISYITVSFQEKGIFLIG